MNLPSLAGFFLLMVYLIIGSAVLSLCIMIIGAGIAQVRKQWPK